MRMPEAMDRPAPMEKGSEARPGNDNGILVRKNFLETFLWQDVKVSK